MGRNKNVMHNDAGKKILHPAEALRKKQKKQKLEKMKKERLSNFEKKLVNRSPEEIERLINEMKEDEKRKAAFKIDTSKFKKDKLNRLETGFKRLKEKVDEKHKERMDRPKSSLDIDFEELKIHRKSSIFYHPVMNPYGAPPTGQTLMYKHPDGSVKRDPPPLVEGPADSLDKESEAKKADGSGSGSESDDVDDDEEDDEEMPLLPEALPGMESSSSSAVAAAPAFDLPSCLPSGLPPLPPGLPPAPGLPPLPPGVPGMPPGGLPPLPGMPPIAAGQSSLPPFGQAPLPDGLPPLPFGQPPLPSGQPPLPFMQPPLPGGPPPGGSSPFIPFFSSDAPAMSQADFAASLRQSGFVVGTPPGPPPKPPGPPPKKPPGPPPKPAGLPVKAQDTAKAPAPEASRPTVSDLPEGIKAPPPPPKRAAPKPAAPQIATLFTPTALRTKRPIPVAGSSQQVSSASLSQVQRKTVVLTEKPRVAEKVNMDEEFDHFMQELEM